MPPRRTKRAAAPVVEPDEEFEEVTDDTEDELDDLEELEDAPEDDDDEEEEPAPKRGRKAAAKTAPAKKAAAKATPEKSGFDSNWLADHVNENVDGANLTSRDVRMLLRKLAKNGDLQREVGTDRARYDFPKGANDPVVKKVLAAVKRGELKAEKKAAVDALKEKTAAKKTPAKTAKAPAKAAATPARRKRRATQEA